MHHCINQRLKCFAVIHFSAVLKREDQERVVQGVLLVSFILLSIIFYYFPSSLHARGHTLESQLVQIHRDSAIAKRKSSASAEICSLH